MTSTDNTGNGSNGHLLYNLVLFGRVLRGLGMDVSAGAMLDVARALEHVNLGRRSDFYHSLRCLLVHRQSDLPLFDEAFRTFWRRPPEGATTLDMRSMGEQRRYRRPQVGPPPPGVEQPGGQGTDNALEGEHIDLSQTYSAREVLRRKDFAKYSLEETAQARAMMAAMAWDVGQRVTRRWQAGTGSTLDLRRTLRRNFRYGGELLDLAYRQRRYKSRPLVLICDVSGSMEMYTRMLLHFVHTVMGELQRVEAFLFATRLTRVTGELQHRNIDHAVTQVSRAVPDWAGGTRIGETLRVFNFTWARRVLGRGAVVLLITDGWDRGEPELLAQEMARLQRSCHRLIWLNPLLGSPEYQPLTAGAVAALPWVDDFLPAQNLASLQDLATHLNSLPARRPPRRQQIRPVAKLAAEALAPPDASSAATTPPPASQPGPTFHHPLWRGNAP